MMPAGGLGPGEAARLTIQPSQTIGREPSLIIHIIFNIVHLQPQEEPWESSLESPSVLC